MHKYFKPIAEEDQSSKKRRADSSTSKHPSDPVCTTTPSLNNTNHSIKSHVEGDFPELESDPGKRPKITDYNPNIRERVRRKYYSIGPCQPLLDEFPQTNMYGILRRFNRMWYDDFKWLEYSIEKDAAFCICCYLFKNELGHQGGGDTFVSEGFRDWRNKDKFRKHEGSSNSAHRQALSKCVDLFNENQHIETAFFRANEDAKKDYRTRLNASIDCIRWLLKQGHSFRGHDESKKSLNRGNYIELLQFLCDHNEDVSRVSLDNAPGNDKLIASGIQKELTNACAVETTKAIMKELGNRHFSVLLDESRDVSTKEQMAVVLRFVDRKGGVVERLLGFKNVKSTTSLSLKVALEDLLSLHGLSISMLRGQGYDGASNMQGEFNGLKALILKENECAYYVHCFAHQLQLALVAVAKDHVRVASLFLSISNIVNVVGGSCKRQDLLREKQVEKIIQGLESEEIATGRGLNQERSISRPSDTRWGSHYRTLMSLIHMFTSTLEVIDIISDEGKDANQRALALNLLKEMQTFEFVFHLHLMKTILGITNDLSQALQRKDQDIANAMVLVDISKTRLQMTRDEGWSSLMDEVSNFCIDHDIIVPSMDDFYVKEKRPQRRVEKVTNLHHYHVELFNTVIDKQLQELNNRFNEVNSELLLCVACLNPSNSFVAFDKERLTRLARFYPRDFSEIELMAFPDQLENFIMDMRRNCDELELKGLGDVSKVMVETRRDLAYPSVYKLLTLALILPVATATVERAFSAMKIVKNRLRNRMGDDWMNDSLIVYIEKDVFNTVSNEAIMQNFQDMEKRRCQLF